jgi:hypothetical protein
VKRVAKWRRLVLWPTSSQRSASGWESGRSSNHSHALRELAHEPVGPPKAESEQGFYPDVALSEERGLLRERDGSGSCKRHSKRGENAEIGVKLHLRQPAYSERGQASLVFEPTETALDSAATTVEVAPALRLAWNERVQAADLDPPARRGTLSSRAAPLRPLAPEVCSAKSGLG